MSETVKGTLSVGEIFAERGRRLPPDSDGGCSSRPIVADKPEVAAAGDSSRSRGCARCADADE